MLKTERLGVLVTTLEKAALQRLAEAEGGLSQAALVRRLIRREAQRQGLWPTAKKAVELSEASQQDARSPPSCSTV